jgi:ABC-type uncharacterized transport system substrate-binding protein
MSSNHPFIGIFMNLGEGDREISARIDAFLEGVNSGGVGPGPVPGLTIALRFGNADFGNYQTIANELYNLRVDGAGPDLYFTTCWPSLRILWAFPRPVVFAGIPWIGTTPPYPNNVYGFVSAGANVCREWVALLNDITQGTVKRVGVIFDDDKNRPDARNRIWTEISNQAATYNITPTPINCGSGTLDQDIKAFAQAATTPAGLIVAMSALTAKRREVVTLAAKNLRLPTIYPNRLYTVHGGSIKCAGLASRGTYLPDLYRKAGGYARQLIDHNVPNPQINQDQADPTKAKFETVINLNAAEAISLTVPLNVLNGAALIIR